jgi:magnesium-dependent phosphatase-1
MRIQWYPQNKYVLSFVKKGSSIENLIITNNDSPCVKEFKRGSLIEARKINDIQLKLGYLKEAAKQLAVEEILVDKYDLFLFDFDNTIVDGECGCNMVPPFKKISENTIVDSEGKKIFLKLNVKDVLTTLRKLGKSIGLISKSENTEVENYEDQPVILLLKEFKILNLFNHGIVVERDLPKSAFIPQNIDKNRIIFIDDDIKNLREVAINQKIDVYDAKGMNFVLESE